VRLDVALGGGCMMDLGCYDIMAIRFLWCGWPPVVRSFMHHPNEKFTGSAQIVGQVQGSDEDSRPNTGPSRAIWANPVQLATLYISSAIRRAKYTGLHGTDFAAGG
jgi:hypothetical protein